MFDKKNNLLNFIIENYGNFVGCLIGALDPWRIIISKVSKRVEIFRLFRTFLQILD